MTNRQLARWLQLGKGQMLYCGVVRMTHEYARNEDDREVDHTILIRNTGATVWRVPQQEED